MVEYSVAKDANGRYWHIDNVPLTNRPKFTCPECDSPMASAKGKVYAHHFKHLVKNIHDNETPLHQDTKWLFYQKIKDCIDSIISFHLNCECHTYGNEYKRISYGISDTNSVETKFCPSLEINPFTGQRRFIFNLVDEVSDIKVEKHTKDGFVPDISLYDKNGDLITAIEIVHTHEDSDEKCEYYFQRGINVVYVRVENETDLLKYKNNNFSKITFNLNRNGCKIPIITTRKMLVDHLHLREQIFQDKFNTALQGFFSTLDEYTNRTVIEQIEMKLHIACEKEKEIKRQRENERKKHLAEVQKRHEKEKLLREEEQKRIMQEYKLKKAQKTADIEVRKKQLLALETKGTCFNCRGEGYNVSIKSIPEIDLRFNVSIYHCNKCYNDYVSKPIDDKLNRAIEDILSNQIV